MESPVRSPRVECVVDVVIHDGGEYPLLVSPGKTVNVSATGLLMCVPLHLDAAVGTVVVVTLSWPGGRFESTGKVVRFESPFRGDASRRVMGVSLRNPLPEALVIPSLNGATLLVAHPTPLPA